MIDPNWSCLRLLMHFVPCALHLARLRAGSSIAARMAMMAMTTNNSIKVKPEAKQLSVPGRSARVLADSNEDRLNVPTKGPTPLDVERCCPRGRGHSVLGSGLASGPILLNAFIF